MDKILSLALSYLYTDEFFEMLISEKESQD
jgi:hypothetical protein